MQRRKKDNAGAAARMGVGLVLAFMLLATPVMLGQIRQYPESPGEVGIHVNILNRDDHRENDLQVEVVIYDLGIVQVTQYFSVRDDQPWTENLFINIPSYGAYAAPGEYLARISLIDDDEGVIDVEHRYVTIV